VGLTLRSDADAVIGHRDNRAVMHVTCADLNRAAMWRIAARVFEKMPHHVTDKLRVCHDDKRIVARDPDIVPLDCTGALCGHVPDGNTQVEALARQRRRARVESQDREEILDDVADTIGLTDDRVEGRAGDGIRRVLAQ